MSRYRVKEVRDKFIPQYKGWFFGWQNFTRTEVIDPCSMCKMTFLISFDSLEKATEFIKEKTGTLPKTPAKYHYL